MAVILRDVPRGISWGWYMREEGRMHLRTMASAGLDSYKVWLEKKGKRVCQADGPIPSVVFRKLKAEVTRKRLHIEGRWINSMIEQGWLEMRMRGTAITLIAYPKTPGNRFTRSVDLREYLPGICEKSIGPKQVVLSSTFPCLEIWPEKKESLRSHILLPPILWEN
jgi:hypothetical protein